MLASEETPDHFLGAVVIKTDRPKRRREPEIWNVIDGQQRLTTLQLLLDAAYRVFDAVEHDGADEIVPMVKNRETVVETSEAFRFKVLPTEPDQEAFQQVMLSADPDQLSADIRSTRVAKCHRFFRRAIKGWLGNDLETRSQRAETLETVLRFHLTIVVLELAQDDNEHIIYETLNARGTPLLAWDHARNYIVNRLRVEEGPAEKPATEHIAHFSDKWWDQEIGAGYARRSRVDAFLAYWLMMKEAAEVPPRPASRLARTFQDHAQSRRKAGERIRDVAEELGLHSVVYREFEELDDDSDLGRFVVTWRALNMGMFTPAILRILTAEPSEIVRNRSIKAIESYLVRRMVCGQSTRGYFEVVLGLLARLKGVAAEQLDSATISYFQEQETDRRLWPDDPMFRRYLIEERLAGRIGTGRVQAVLRSIENLLATPKADVTVVAKRLTVEHLMPQEWSENYPLEETDGESEENDPKEIRDRLVHSLGNLTLLTKSLNSAASNSAWPTKVELLEEHSALALNRDLIKNHPSSWSEGDILERGARLADLAIRAWPGPDDL